MPSYRSDNELTSRITDLKVQLQVAVQPITNLGLHSYPYRLMHILLHDIVSIQPHSTLSKFRQ